jgi:hypothetical protein
VLGALLGRESEFVRTPKHGIRGKLERWSSKKYRAAKSITPVIEVAMAGYFTAAMVVAFDNGHYLSMPFLALFLCGFGYVGCVSLWQGSLGIAARGLATRLATARRVTVVPPPAFYRMSESAAAGPMINVDVAVEVSPSLEEGLAVSRSRTAQPTRLS